MNFLLAASIETLITLLIFVVIAGLSSWLKKKQQAEEDTDSWSPPTSQPPPPIPRRHGPAQTEPQPEPERRATSWEEELRRLLEGEPTPPPPPPPVIVTTLPAPAPPPIPQPRPVTVTRALPERERPGRMQLPGLVQSTERYQRAKQLDRQVQDQLRLVQQRIQKHAATLEAPHAAAERLLARALLRDRQSLRSAVVASVILGPPRAFEPH